MNTPNTIPRPHPRPCAGFTLPEVMLASTIGLFVTTAFLSVFLWAAAQATLCSRIGWSENEALRSSDKLIAYVRNASEIADIDQVEGTWVQLAFPDGTIGTISYSNAVPLVRDGRLYLSRSNFVDVIVARGLTEIQDDQGFTTPVFTKSRNNCLRIAYRVSEPVLDGTRAADDADFAACVRFAACLRNAIPGP